MVALLPFLLSLLVLLVTKAQGQSLLCVLVDGVGFATSPNTNCVISDVIDVSKYTFPFFQVINNSTITVFGDYARNAGLVINTAYFEVDASSTIVAIGYPHESGPGKGISTNSSVFYAGGASHAGRGKLNVGFENATGVYGDFMWPTNLGSGGGSAPGGQGGAGGGAIAVFTSLFNCSGTLDVRGQDGVGKGGGGSGGSVSLKRKKLH
eukprot:Phypoly_transcript_09890.p1 GENE.Phypoly_transcript_09890~~Phypoly_transcript_09890.p1  ORF type:complete len:208 (-),score=37.23 Phypoly_transcript_09890:677-1300(-)